MFSISYNITSNKSKRSWTKLLGRQITGVKSNKSSNHTLFLGHGNLFFLGTPQTPQLRKSQTVQDNIVTALCNCELVCVLCARVCVCAFVSWTFAHLCVPVFHPRNSTIKRNIAKVSKIHLNQFGCFWVEGDRYFRVLEKVSFFIGHRSAFSPNKA